MKSAQIVKRLLKNVTMMSIKFFCTPKIGKEAEKPWIFRPATSDQPCKTPKKSLNPHLHIKRLNRKHFSLPPAPWPLIFAISSSRSERISLIQLTQ